MVDQVARYRKALKQDLRCSRKVKKRLLEKFSLSLSAFLEDVPSPGMDQLYAAFGPPNEMVDVLLAEVTPKEAAQYHRKNIILRIFAGILTAVLLAGATYVYFLKEQAVVHDDHVRIVIKTEGEPMTVDENQGTTE